MASTPDAALLLVRTLSRQSWDCGWPLEPGTFGLDPEGDGIALRVGVVGVIEREDSRLVYRAPSCTIKSECEAQPAVVEPARFIEDRPVLLKLY